MTSTDAAKDRKGRVDVRLALSLVRSCCFADKSPCSRSQASVAISGHVVGVHCSSKVGEYHEAFGGPGWPGSSAPCGMRNKPEPKRQPRNFLQSSTRSTIYAGLLV